MCCIAIIIIISITTMQIQMYIQAKTGKYKYRPTVVSDTNGLLIPDFGSLTRGERLNSYYANHPQCAVHLVVFKISVSRDPKNTTTSFNGWNPTLCLNGSNSIFNWLFFKILKFSGPSFPGMMSSTLQPHFLYCVFFDNGDCYIFCAPAQNCTQWLCTWTLDLNSSKPNRTEW